MWRWNCFMIQIKLPLDVETQNTIIKSGICDIISRCFKQIFYLVSLKGAFLSNLTRKRGDRTCTKIKNISGRAEQLLEYIGLVRNNNCVISRQTFLNSIRRDESVSVKCDANNNNNNTIYTIKNWWYILAISLSTLH